MDILCDRFVAGYVIQFAAHSEECSTAIKFVLWPAFFQTDISRIS